MRIQSIHVDNFKSLVDFRLDFAKFTCLIGLNGSGKSTVLQFLDFLSQLMRGDIKGWLAERKWLAKELRSRCISWSPIKFVASVGDDRGERYVWTAKFNPRLLRCVFERIDVGETHLEVRKGRLSISSGGDESISFQYQGSILSQLKESAVPTPLKELKRFFQNVESLDLLSPHFLHQRTRESEGSLGHGGQRLSAFLHELGPKKRHRLAKRLKSVFPKLKDVHTRSLKSGWKQLEILEEYAGGHSRFLPALTTEARHVADGLLRLIAILAEMETDHSVLLLDEIENGINPEVVEFVLDALVSAPQQVLVTTHSPMILNYLDDDVAREGVMYLYKTRHGITQAKRFFEIPSIAEKLTVMGPGEAFADTDLTALHEEIEAVAGGR